MADFMFLFHRDAPRYDREKIWTWLDKLKASGKFAGGSAMGGGACFRKDGQAALTTSHIGGFVRVEANDLAEAQSLLEGCPDYEAGGTVEIRELPRG